MSNSLKHVQHLTLRIALLLSVAINFSVNAASYNIADEISQQTLSMEGVLSGFDSQVENQKQAMEAVKSNYLMVIDLLKKKHTEEANTKVTELIQQDPSQSVYYNLQALLQLVNKDQAGAEQSFLKAVELNSKNSQALTGLAKLALDNKQLDKATSYANQLIAINLDDIKAYQVLADVTLQQQGIDAVEVLLLDTHSKVTQHSETELAIVQALGKVYLKKKQPEKFLALATDLVERNKTKPSALSLLAEAQLINKKYSGAEKTLRQIIALQPADAKHRFMLARLLGQQTNKENEILALLDKAAENMDNPALVLSYKAAVLLKQKHYVQALTIAQQVDKANPAQSIGKALKGDVFFAQQKYPQALTHYQQAYAITPNIKVLDAILNLLTLQNKTQQSITFLEKELAKNTDNTAIQFRLAMAYQTTQQNKLSIKHYEAVLTKQKDHAIALNNLASLYSLQKNPKAIELAKHAYNIAPKSGAIADTYGYILLKQGDKQKSLNVLKQAAELDPKLIEIQLHLAEAYIANQEKEPAKTLLQKVLNNKAANQSEQEKTQKLLADL